MVSCGATKLRLLSHRRLVLTPEVNFRVALLEKRGSIAFLSRPSGSTGIHESHSVAERLNSVNTSHGFQKTSTTISQLLEAQFEFCGP